MPMLRLSVMLLALLWPALAPAGDCSALVGWEDGRRGLAEAPACTAETYLEAHRLGAALADLEAQHAALEERIGAAAEAEIGSLRRRQRQLMVDIEAIHGVAALRGWPRGPVKPAATAQAGAERAAQP